MFPKKAFYLCKEPMKDLRISRVILVAAILLIATFQFYWLNRLYQDEWNGLKKETNGIFRDVVYKMQVDRFKADSFFFNKGTGENLFVYNIVNAIRQQSATGSVKTSETDSTHIWSGKTTVLSGLPVNAAQAGTTQMRINDGKEVKDNLNVITVNSGTGVQLPPSLDSAMMRKMSQSGMKMMIHFSKNGRDTFTMPAHSQNALPVFINDAKPGLDMQGSTRLSIIQGPGSGQSEKSVIRMITNGRAFDDSLPVKQMDSIYRKELAKAGISIGFLIYSGKADSLHKKDTISAARFTTHPTTVGIVHPYWYQAGFANPVSYLLRKISLQILFSVFLVAFTTAAFVFLFRNLLAQRKLTEMKNDFISNITHELKTPLATVSVAVEALRNFGGLQKPEKTKEYLDISASELQRLNLLVEKVLKLSLFENRELDLRKETIDLRQLIEEVLNTLKLQFEARQANVHFETQGSDFTMNADKLHITSVIFNLLDNALKYSKGIPDITVRLTRQENDLLLEVEDKGMGIPEEYRSRVFDRFFRIPSGDHHNTKGYGLGLSYVAHVVKKHQGVISVVSEPGTGSLFTIKFPIV